MNFVVYFNFVISVLFTICYFYQFVYVAIGLVKKPTVLEAKKQHKYAVIVSARNEANMIGNLLDSIKNQDYPPELIDTFVVADNCTDTTAEAARTHGATVYERFNDCLIGKGYALDWLFKKIKEDFKDSGYEAFIVFDADNIIDPNFISEMNKAFDSGYRIVTSYRNSKNYGENWISAGYSLWFLREAKFLNNSRMRLGTSCAISGTGFLVSTEIINKNNGWIHHLLTEDIEFTADNVIKGETIGYCENAVLYDEQPVSFYQSYLQRLRWSKGFYQVFAKYGAKLFAGMLKGSFACYDMLMTISPAMLLTLASTVINLIAIVVGVIVAPEDLPVLFKALWQTLSGFYSMFFFLGAITTVTERKRIHCSTLKKIGYAFTFPIFMLTYMPISVISLFKRVKWVPINHSVSMTVYDICKDEPNIEISNH